MFSFFEAFSGMEVLGDSITSTGILRAYGPKTIMPGYTPEAFRICTSGGSGSDAG